MSESYDLIVIGGGPGGYAAAIRGAQNGLRTALVEEGKLGGTCLNKGCIPTKTLIYASQLYREVLEGEAIGLFADCLQYDLEALHRRKDEVVEELRNGVSYLLKANGVTCYAGRGVITNQNIVKVSGNEIIELKGTHIILATGASPQKPNIPGMNLRGVVTSDELLTEIPMDCKRLLVIGGGVIGTELASIYANLECEVVILEAMDRILPQLDREISQNLSMILKKRGMKIYTGSTVKEITTKEEALSVRFEGKNGEESAEGDLVLVSIGRRANIGGLLDGGMILDTDQRGILVNERFETSIPGIYAIGDCVSGNIQLAHVAAAQAANVVAQISGEDPEKDLSVVPACVYTNPEIAWVGLTVDEAKKMGKAVKTSKYAMTGNGKSLIERQDRGFVKLVFDAETETLLGAQLMCGRATDLIGELCLAIVGKCTAKELSSVIRSHPTFGEGVGEAAESLFERAVHVVPKKKSNCGREL